MLPKLLVKTIMSSQAVVADPSDDLDTLMNLMDKEDIRHLPLVRHGELMGLVSDRDIALATSLRSNSLKNTKAKDICATHVYETHLDSFVQDVAREMASKKYGSAVITENNKVVGIITTTDICRALADVLAGDFTYE